MKKILAILVVLAAQASVAQNISTIVTCPGADASHTMRISWAADASGSEIIYRTASDNDWEKAKRLRPETEFRCVTFDSIYSKAADNSDIYEYPAITKCGATLKGLTPNTRYEYMIIDKQGTPASDVHSFVTAGAESWTCCVISDFHAYTPLKHRQTDAMAMIDAVKTYKPFDWVLHLGDVTAWGGSFSFWQSLYAERYFTDYMWAGVNGNHDNMTRGFVRTSNDFFRQTNYYPENGYLREEGVCYHFRYGEVMFVMLNSEDMRSRDGFEAARAWLEKVVTGARNSANAPRYVVVCEHYQWFDGVNGKDSQYARWRDTFDYLGIDLALAGNNHIYVRTDAIYHGEVTDGSRGTVYIQSPSSDNERGRNMKELTHNEHLIRYRWAEGPQMVGAMSMTVDSNKMHLTLLDRHGNILDTATVKAKR